MKGLNTFKTVFDIISVRLLGILIPILCFSIYLTYYHIWYDFFDYSIFGIKTFSNYIPYSNLLHSKDILAYIIPVFITTISIICLVTYLKKDWRKIEWVRNLHILFIYSITSAVVIYPIADKQHFTIASICTLISIIYLVHVWIVNVLKIENKKIIVGIKTFIKIFAVLAMLGYAFISLNNIIKYTKEISKVNYLEHFKYIRTQDILYERISEIGKYIINKQNEGKDVIIIDTMAAAINIPINKYYKDYDMFNIGNFGEKGEKRNNTGFKFKRKYIVTGKERYLY